LRPSNLIVSLVTMTSRQKITKCTTTVEQFESIAHCNISKTTYHKLWTVSLWSCHKWLIIVFWLIWSDFRGAFTEVEPYCRFGAIVKWVIFIRNILINIPRKGRTQWGYTKFNRWKSSTYDCSSLKCFIKILKIQSRILIQNSS
jgi:hypothetical protein